MIEEPENNSNGRVPHFQILKIVTMVKKKITTLNNFCSVLFLAIERKSLKAKKYDSSVVPMSLGHLANMLWRNEETVNK